MLPLFATALIAVAALAGGSRALVMRRREAALARRLAVGADGVIPGAGAIDLPMHAFGDSSGGSRDRDVAGARGALLLHGFGDTPQTLAALAAHLRARGWAVRAPLLPGHGRTLAAFSRARADQWIDCVREELAAFQTRYPEAAVVGLSMGGALASIVIANSATPPPALVLIAPYVSMPTTVRRMARLHHVIGLLFPYVSGGGDGSIHDAAAKAQSLAYGACTPRLLHELGTVVQQARRALPQLRMPTLVLQSRLDNRIPVAAAERAFAMIGAPEKRLEWLDVGGHVITVDAGRERVFALVAEWLEQHHHRPAAERATAAVVAGAAGLA